MKQSLHAQAAGPGRNRLLSDGISAALVRRLAAQGEKKMHHWIWTPFAPLCSYRRGITTAVAPVLSLQKAGLEAAAEQLLLTTKPQKTDSNPGWYTANVQDEG